MHKDKWAKKHKSVLMFYMRNIVVKDVSPLLGSSLQILFCRGFYIIVILMFLFISCTSRTRLNNEYATAHIDSTKKIHWGRGFFKQRVYYTFYLDTLRFNCINDFKLGYSYSGLFSPGDSALVNYNDKKPEESEIVKLVYKKRKINL